MENKEQLMQDFQYMKQIVNDSRKLIVNNGIAYIVWGAISIVGLLLTYIDIVTAGEQYTYIVWPVLIGIGWIFSLFSYFKKKNKNRVSTFAGKLTASTWQATGVSLTILGMIGLFTNAYSGVYIPPILSVVFGTAFYISAILYDSKMMKITAPIWWLAGIYMFLFPTKETILIMAGLILFCQLIPGILFYRKVKSERV